MRRSPPGSLLVAAAALLVLAACASPTGKSGMSFFVTSAGPGKGGDLGGLAGADRHCQTLAAAAGAGVRNWKAYLSAQPVGGQAGVNARDRIGKGPWQNAQGVVVATDLAQLHGANNISKQTALTEKGAGVNGRGDTPNVHDVLTGSQPDGNFIAGEANSTCANWMMGEGGAAMVGHHDRMGPNDSAPAKSWNSSHQSRGCSMDQLKTTGGAGLFYCFAAD
ncbi:MAG: lectin [Chitinophagaceae bacterium]|nr:lectin [Rubrivivax sp.]